MYHVPVAGDEGEGEGDHGGDDEDGVKHSEHGQDLAEWLLQVDAAGKEVMYYLNQIKMYYILYHFGLKCPPPTCGTSARRWRRGCPRGRARPPPAEPRPLGRTWWPQWPGPSPSQSWPRVTTTAPWRRWRYSGHFWNNQEFISVRTVPT